MEQRKSSEKTVANNGNGGATPSTAIKVAIIELIPQLSWAIVAVVAIILFWKPLVTLVDEGRISKVDIGVVQIEIAQAAIANIKTPGREGIPNTPAAFKP